jgi:hypothetical protein
LVENRIYGAARGILTGGPVRHIHITGNILWGCFQTAINHSDPSGDTEGLLIANNTIFDNVIGLRFWDRRPYETYKEGQIEIRNNLIFRATEADAIYFQWIAESQLGPRRAEHSLYEAWRVGDNWRDRSGNRDDMVMELASKDHALGDVKFLSSNLGDDDFMRPRADAPYANEGAGREDPALPSYAGAVPPPGTDRWDWELTWDARTQKAKAAPSPSP